jgi:hypothetical protein
LKHPNNNFLVAFLYGSVQLAKPFSRARVSWFGISMPITSGTNSSTNLHISISRVYIATSMTLSLNNHKYIIPQPNHVFDDTYKSSMISSRVYFHHTPPPQVRVSGRKVLHGPPLTGTTCATSCTSSTLWPPLWPTARRRVARYR